MVSLELHLSELTAYMGISVWYVSDNYGKKNGGGIAVREDLATSRDLARPREASHLAKPRDTKMVCVGQDQLKFN